MKKSEEEDDENVMLIRHVQRKQPALFDYVICIKDFNTDGAMGAHYKKHHPNENIPDLPFTCKLIRKSYDFVDRKNWQTKEIDIRQPSVNVQLMATKEHNLPWTFS